MENQILDDDFKPQSDRFNDQKFAEQIRLAKIEVNSNIGDVKVGRGTLIVLAILSLISFSINIYDFHSRPILDILYNIFSLFFYFICMWNAKYSPNKSLWLGLGLGFYIFQLMLASTLDGSISFLGFFMSIPIFYFLGSGIMAANELKKNLVRLSNLGIGRKELEEVTQLKRFERT